jgi:hypothetical protein
MEMKSSEGKIILERHVVDYLLILLSNIQSTQPFNMYKCHSSLHNMRHAARYVYNLIYNAPSAF